MKRTIALIVLAVVLAHVAVAQVPEFQFPNLGEWFQNAVQQLQDMVNGFIQWINQNVTQPVADRIYGFVRDVINWFFETIASFINTYFIEPFSNIFSNIGRAIYNTIVSVYNAIRNALERILFVNETATSGQAKFVYFFQS